MTAQNRTALKAVFEQGDTPQGSDFANMIDSPLNLADTSAQTVVSHVTFSGGANIATLSAASVNIASFFCASAKVQTGLGIGTAAPAEGLFLIATGSAAVRMDVNTTVAASGGGGGATPTSAAGFIALHINGALRMIPFFNPK